MTQLTMLLPKVDEKATRAKVKKLFDRYHDTKASLTTLENANPTWFIDSLPGGNATAMYPQFDADMIRGGKVHDVGQELTVLAERMHAHQEHVKRMQAFCESIERVVDNLPDNERTVIKCTLLIDKFVRKKDKYIFPELGMTKNVFYDHKEKALLRIAFALRIEVYEKEGDHAA